MGPWLGCGKMPCIVIRTHCLEAQAPESNAKSQIEIETLNRGGLDARLRLFATPGRGSIETEAYVGRMLPSVLQTETKRRELDVSRSRSGLTNAPMIADGQLYGQICIGMDKSLWQVIAKEESGPPTSLRTGVWVN